MALSANTGSRIRKILFNTALLLILFSAAALREGSWFGIRVHDAGINRISEYRSKAPSATELQKSGYAGVRLLRIDRGIWRMIDRSGQQTGFVVSTAAYDRTAGYAGPIPMRLYLDGRQVVRSVRILPNNETPSFMRRILAAGFLNNWIGRSVANIRKRRADIVSGATMSSVAIIHSISRSLSALAGTKMVALSAAPGVVATAVAGALVLLAVFFSFRPGRFRRLRPFLLVLNVIVIGFWAGQFLSLSALFGWLKSGSAPWIGLVFLIGAGLLLPLLGKRNFFCTWICPYGSLQELLGKIFRIKMRIASRVYAVLKRVRDGLLLLLLILLWAGAGSAVLNYEPFSAFLFQYASVPVLVIASVFLLLSLFISRPWCRFFCPTGALLSRMSGNQRL